ncbi:MAG: hypothetical protein V5783_01910, partial [Pontiella sp.]
MKKINYLILIVGISIFQARISFSDISSPSNTENMDFGLGFGEVEESEESPFFSEIQIGSMDRTEGWQEEMIALNEDADSNGVSVESTMVRPKNYGNELIDTQITSSFTTPFGTDEAVDLEGVNADELGNAEEDSSIISGPVLIGIVLALGVVIWVR